MTALLLTLLAACSPQALLLRSAADALASQGSAPEEDLELAREASAFYLKLSESALRAQPGHLPLAQAVAGGFTQYAYAFVAFEADRLESTNAAAAQRLRERAARLYLRARGHSLAALEVGHPGLRAALAAGGDPDALRIGSLRADEVGVAYWAAASWAAWIALSTDSPEAVAQLPQAIALARAAWTVLPDFGDGALATLMGSLETARPGGSTRQARAYFDRAVAISGGRSAAPFVAMAESLALPAGDRSAFESLLQQALAAADTRHDLPNAAMAERARWLLSSIAERF